MTKSPIAQELANYFASWTRVQQQDQSVGFQILNTLAQPLENMQDEISRAGANAFLSTYNLDEISNLHRVDLPPDFAFEVESDDELVQHYVTPVVRGLSNAVWYPLTAVTDNSVKALCYEIEPNRLTLADQITPTDTLEHLLLVDLEPSNFPYTTELTHHLGAGWFYFEAKGGTNYISSTLEQLSRARVVVEGITRKGTIETDVIVFPWEMRQRSLKEWRTLTSIEVYDFPDGATLSISSAAFNADNHLDIWNYRFSSEDNKIDTFWGLDHRDAGDPEVSFTTLNMLEYVSDEWTQLITMEPEKQAMKSWDLLDDQSVVINGIDLAPQPFSHLIWVLDDTGMLHAYSSREEYYDSLDLIKDRTPGSHVIIETSNPSYVLHDDIEFVAIHIRPEKELRKYRVWYQTPSGDQYGLVDNIAVPFSSDFWISMVEVELSRTIGRLVTISAEEYGNYLLTIDVVFADGEAQTEKLLVPVLQKTALVSLDVATDIGEAALGIEFDSDQLLWVRGATKYHQINLLADKMLIDFTRKVIFTKEEYEQIEVTVDV